MVLAMSLAFYLQGKFIAASYITLPRDVTNTLRHAKIKTINIFLQSFLQTRCNKITEGK